MDNKNTPWDIELGLVASGLFTPSTQPVSFEFANPYQPTPVEAEPIQASLETLGSNDEKVIVINDDHLANYGEQLTKVALNLSSNMPDIILIPCRGALKPWRQVEAMCLHQLNGFLFLSTGLGSGKNVDRVRELLRGAIGSVNTDPLNVAVLDTAKGGNGSFALAQLLKSLWREEDGREWAVQFHLLAAKDSRIALDGTPIYSLTEKGFYCHASVYRVDDLLVEDWDPAFGIKVSDGSKTLLKPLRNDHLYRVAVQRDGKTFVTESQAPYDMINKLIAKHVTEAVLADPWIVQTADLTQQPKRDA